MLRTQNVGEKSPHRPDRYLFVIALRGRYPFFWSSLNQLWRRGGILDRDALGASPLDDWLVEIGVIDGWLIDYVMATLDLWSHDSDGGNANLDPKHPWFAVPNDAADSEELAGHRLFPIWIDRYPRYRGPDDLSGLTSRMRNLSIDDQEFLWGKMDAAGWLETLEEWDERTELDIRRQKADLKRLLRTSRYGFDHAEGFKHAQWTALAFGGMSYAEIARHELASSSHLDARSTVRKAVVRFAEDIDLTLPSRRSRG